MLIIILTGVHVHTCFNLVFLIWAKLSLLRMSAILFQDREAHAVFLLLSCELYRCHEGLDIYVIIMSNTGQQELPGSLAKWTLLGDHI